MMQLSRVWTCERERGAVRVSAEAKDSSRGDSGDARQEEVERLQEDREDAHLVEVENEVEFADVLEAPVQRLDEDLCSMQRSAVMASA